MRKAAAGWEEDYAKRMEGVGFRRGKGGPTVFFNSKTDVRVVVYGDDFTFSGTREELEKMRSKMGEWYDIKDRGGIMGGAQAEIKEVTILGRTVRWTAEGIEYEADAGHRKKLMDAEGLEETSKSVVGPVMKENIGRQGAEEETLEEKWEQKEFRSKGARLNYLGQDRSDIQYAVKEICQGMSKPTVEGRTKIKRAVRYLVGAKRLVWKYTEKEDDAEDVLVDVFVDSDWASGWQRKSTRGGMMTVDGVGVKHWSRTQKARALSVGEAEYYAMVTGCAEGLGLQALADDLGWKVMVRIWTDSSVAKAVASRRGLGKLRHVELKWLWVQDMVKEGRVKLRTVRGDENVADHLTKPKTRAEVEWLLEKVGAEFRE